MTKYNIISEDNFIPEDVRREYKLGEFAEEPTSEYERAINAIYKDWEYNTDERYLEVMTKDQLKDLYIDIDRDLDMVIYDGDVVKQKVLEEKLSIVKKYIDNQK